MSEIHLAIAKGITITPPLLGRITLGHSEILDNADGTDSAERPVKDDYFTITTLTQRPDRSWEIHPLQATLVKDGEKLTRIPVRLAHNDPALTLHNSYSCLDPQTRTTGRVLCAGNGVTARRATVDGIKNVPCPQPEACEFACMYQCKIWTRAYFQIEGQDDDLGTFILRSTGRTTLNEIASPLQKLAGLTRGKLAGMPLMLELRQKTSAQSNWDPYYYAALRLRPDMSLIDTVEAARAFQKKLEDAELDLDEMDAAVRAGRADSEFTDQIEDVGEWVTNDSQFAVAGQRRPARGVKGLDAALEIARNTASPVEASKPVTGPALKVVATSPVLRGESEVVKDVTELHSPGTDDDGDSHNGDGDAAVLDDTGAITALSGASPVPAHTEGTARGFPVAFPAPGYYVPLAAPWRPFPPPLAMPTASGPPVPPAMKNDPPVPVMA